jgi:hypothetical protein
MRRLIIRVIPIRGLIIIKINDRNPRRRAKAITSPGRRLGIEWVIPHSVTAQKG